ncbi:glycosyltransferase [uncultured Polaribacter sp.]|uniref:glycosyltransferase n=1 Tax=uncultured Polaribacter sp. TaxID=174711 RepID=UPI002638E6EE|nr:glycosyltransferase [uncultured Polaribacter sp.]
MILLVFFYAFVVFTWIQIIYYLIFSSIFKKNNTTKKTLNNNPISIIIFAKNNGENLERFIPFIINQDYPKFEVILINNASNDNTDEIVASLKEKYSKIRIIDVENNEAFWGSKKYALTLGIKVAKHDLLLFTEANCKPVSKSWIKEMNNHFTQKKSIVIGYHKFKKENSLLNILARYKNLLTSIKYLSAIKMGFPYKAAKQNFGYEKSEFFNVNGFINHINLKDGEDDLFIQDAAKKENTTFCISKNSFTESKSPSTFINWFQQIKIDNSTQKHYKFGHQFYLKIFLFTKSFTYILSTVLFFFYPWKIILAILSIYFIVQFLVIGFLTKKLNEPQVTFFLPILEIGLLIFHFSIFITNLISKRNN